MRFLVQNYMRTISAPCNIQTLLNLKGNWRAKSFIYDLKKKQLKTGVLSISLEEIIGFRPIRVKPVIGSHSKRRPKLVFKTDYHLMQVKSIAECSKRAFCNTLTFIKLSFVFKTFVLSIFECCRNFRTAICSQRAPSL